MKHFILFCTLIPLCFSQFEANFGREKRYAQQHQNYQQPQINYRPLAQAPANIKQLLELQQAREPIHHLPAQAPPTLSKTPTYPTPQYQAAQRQQPAPAPAPAPYNNNPQYQG